MACKNCTSNLQTHHNYCPECGAKVIRNRLTLKALFSHFSEQFLNYDNKFFQTFKNIFIKPEKVIGSYIDGTRKKYVNVISYFAIALTLSGFQLFVVNKFFPELMNVDFMAQEGAEEFQQQNMNFAQEYQSIIFMLSVPLYALVSKIVFFNYKQYNYTEHLVINMYLTAHLSIVFSFVFLITSLFGINYGIVGFLSIPLQILFSAYCFKRIFKLGYTSIFLKTFLFLLILLMLFILLSISMGIMMYYDGTMQELIDAQKAAKET